MSTSVVSAEPKSDQRMFSTFARQSIIAALCVASCLAAILQLGAPPASAVTPVDDGPSIKARAPFADFEPLGCSSATLDVDYGFDDIAGDSYVEGQFTRYGTLATPEVRLNVDVFDANGAEMSDFDFFVEIDRYSGVHNESATTYTFSEAIPLTQGVQSMTIVGEVLRPWGGLWCSSDSTTIEVDTGIVAAGECSAELTPIDPNFPPSALFGPATPLGGNDLIVEGNVVVSGPDGMVDAGMSGDPGTGVAVLIRYESVQGTYVHITGPNAIFPQESNPTGSQGVWSLSQVVGAPILDVPSPEVWDDGFIHPITVGFIYLNPACTNSPIVLVDELPVSFFD